MAYILALILPVFSTLALPLVADDAQTRFSAGSNLLLSVAVYLLRPTIY
jgi:hypothetical protein